MVRTREWRGGVGAEKGEERKRMRKRGGKTDRQRDSDFKKVRNKQDRQWQDSGNLLPTAFDLVLKGARSQTTKSRDSEGL